MLQNMRKKFAYFLLSCSLVFILGHSVMPHDHFAHECTKYELKKDRYLSLAEILKLALTHNLGINHLEEFKNCKNLEFTKNESSCFFIFSNGILDIRKHHITLKLDGKASSFFILTLDATIKDNPLRAPPIQS